MPVSNGYVAKSNRTITGAERSGIRAGDLLQEMAERLPQGGPSPMVEKSVKLIEGVKIIGADILTAKDQALYESLLAVARHNGMDRPQHNMPLKTAMQYLGADRGEHVARSLERLTRTVVRYSFRDENKKTYGSMPLILAEITEDLAVGTAVISYTIPDAVKTAVLSATSYTWLEINAFANFGCRYTARLYQRLAVMAGMDKGLRDKWKIEPTELADILGYPKDGDNLHYASFRKRCLEPVLKDLTSHVRRFETSMEEVRGTGRGRPVMKLVFSVTQATREFEEHKAARLKYWKGIHERPDPHHNQDELPSKLAIGRALTATGTDELTASNGWRAALDRAKLDTAVEVAPGMLGRDLLDMVDTYGTDIAFGKWIVAASHSTIPTDRLDPEQARPRSDDDRKLRMIRENAQALIFSCDGFLGDPARGIPSPWTEDTLREQCSMYAAPFNYFGRDEAVPECRAVESRLRGALGVLGRTSPEHRRSGLKSLCAAIVEWDMDRLGKAAGAIIGNGVKQSSRPATVRNSAPPVFNRIKPLTETDGYDPYALRDYDFDRTEMDCEEYMPDPDGQGMDA